MRNCLLYLVIFIVPCAPALAAAPLASLERRGGVCASTKSMCDDVTTLTGDGNITYGSGEHYQVSGEDLAKLKELIAKTDFAAIRTHKFSGTCPMAYDGQESVYTFYTAGGPERLASCEIAFDPWSEPFKTFYNMLSEKHEK